MLLWTVKNYGTQKTVIVDKIRSVYSLDNIWHHIRLYPPAWTSQLASNLCNVIENWKEFHSLNLSLLDFISFPSSHSFLRTNNFAIQFGRILHWFIEVFPRIYQHVCVFVRWALFNSLILMKIYYPQNVNSCRQFPNEGAKWKEKERRRKDCCFFASFFLHVVNIKGIIVKNMNIKERNQ